MRFISVTAVVAVFCFLTVLGYPNREYHGAVPEDQEQQATNYQPQAGDDSDMYMEPLEEDSQPHESNVQVQQAQNFYPSFAPFQDPPLGHSRPFYYQQQQQEAAYSHRPTGFPQQQFGYEPAARFSGYKAEASQKAAVESGDILGSGNFGVIRGGTFYNDNDNDHVGYEDRFNPYYYNGHGRPSYYRGNPRPQKHEQFANFRDFADINTPSSPAYSHFVVVYANRNGTKPHEDQIKNRPRNIIEHLAMLDDEASVQSLDSQENPKKKLSKSKRKLALLPPEKKPYSAKKTTTVKELYEPLLALS